MRLLSLLLCLTISVQLFTFCADRDFAKKEVTYSASYDKHDIADDQHAEGDLCSPFCQCTCCATPTVSGGDPILIQLSLTGNTSFNDIQALGFIDISLPVWQPPQSV